MKLRKSEGRFAERERGPIGIKSDCPAHGMDIKHSGVLQDAIAGQIRNAHHLQGMLTAEADEIRQARHGSVIVRDFADHTRRIQPCETSEIDGRFGMASPLQDAIPASAKRKDVPRPRQIFRTCIRVYDREHRLGTVVRRDSRCDTSSLRIDRHRKGGAAARSIS